MLLLLLACAPELPSGEPVLRYTVETYGEEAPVGEVVLGRSAQGWTETMTLRQGGLETSLRAHLSLEDGALRGLQSYGRVDRRELWLEIREEDGAWVRSARRGAALLERALPGRPEALSEGLNPGGDPDVLAGPALFTWLLAEGERALQATELHEDAQTPMRVSLRERRALEGFGPATRWFVHTPAQGWMVWTRDSDGLVLAMSRPGTRLRAEGLRLPEPLPPEPPADVVEAPLRAPRADTTLGGQLTRLADTPDDAPLVVLIHGSGPGDRHGSYGPLDTWLFDRLAWALAEAGLRVARYDKRGVGASAPEDPEAPMEHTLGALVGDVAAIQGAAGGTCHVLLGHSEGGLAAPARAAQDPRVAGVVMLAGPAAGLDDIVQEQLRTLHLAHGTPPERVEALALEQRALLRTLAQGRERDMGPLPLSAEVSVAWLRSHIEHDSEATLAQLQVPALALFAGEDLQVPRGTQVPLARELLAGNPDAQVEVMEGLDHLFMPVVGSPGMGLYDDTDRAVSEALIARVTRFVSGVPCVDKYKQATSTVTPPSGSGVD